eukprot:GEMP01111160.1.p2 GENE.GEMP01111160.1~~GEMP01111160.1.p2  ORF type:complete len:100 (+),score=8.56 GEMP01111160.1:237-536(+)
MTRFLNSSCFGHNFAAFILSGSPQLGSGSKDWRDMRICWMDNTLLQFSSRMSRHISPFALTLGWNTGDVKAIFVNAIRWSMNYTAPSPQGVAIRKRGES